LIALGQKLLGTVFAPSPLLEFTFAKMVLIWFAELALCTTMVKLRKWFRSNATQCLIWTTLIESNMLKWEMRLEFLPLQRFCITGQKKEADAV